MNYRNIIVQQTQLGIYFQLSSFYKHHQRFSSQTIFSIIPETLTAHNSCNPTLKTTSSPFSSLCVYWRASEWYLESVVCDPVTSSSWILPPAIGLWQFCFSGHYPVHMLYISLHFRLNVKTNTIRKTANWTFFKYQNHLKFITKKTISKRKHPAYGRHLMHTTQDNNRFESLILKSKFWAIMKISCKFPINFLILSYTSCSFFGGGGHVDIKLL